MGFRRETVCRTRLERGPKTRREGYMPRVRTRGAWGVGLFAGAALAVPASAGAITSAQCQARVNDTPSKLVECIQKGDLSAHMDNLQAIANEIGRAHV